MEEEGFVKWFSELSNKSIDVAGGKGASLSEMYNAKFPVPPGFVVTAQAYSFFVNETKVIYEIQKILSGLDIEDTAKLEEASKKIRSMIEKADLPPELEQEIVEAYDILDTSKNIDAGENAMHILRNSKEPPFVAVRSSATTEDLVDASFAGQQDSFLSVKGHKQLIEKVKKCFSSLFTARAIYYRQNKGFAHEKSYLAVVVQKMIDSEKSGVMFSRNPLKDDDNVVIEAVFGLGEGIVSGRISPDHYLVNRELDLLESRVGDKKEAVVRDSSGGIKVVKLTKEKSDQHVLTGHEIKRLAQYGMELEKHYSKPQDIEFAIEKEQIFIVQSRPITTKAKKSSGVLEGSVILSGIGASPGVGSGTVRIVHDLNELSKVKKGDILVTKMTNPDMVVSMQKASGIITDEGGVTSHAAIVSREMGIPAVVGTKEATTKLKEGQAVTVDGSTGRILEGRAEEKRVEVLPIVPTRTKIKVIVDLPDYAERAALSGARGVGLVRLETVIAGSGKHPLYFLKENKIKDYINVIYQGLKKILLPFDEIWVRTSDIRTDEYRNLQDAPEVVEGNPMLGDHGIRFSLKNPDILEAELHAIKELADEFTHKKIGIMVPQLISLEELRKFKKIASGIKLPGNVRIGIMVETPAAVQIIRELCEEGINFISFGTNDLTQYTLAIDRNNEDVQELYSEMNPAVLNSIKYVIRTCKKYNVETSICGQAGSKPEMARFLVEQGIDSISANADAAHTVSKIVAEIEMGGLKENVMRKPEHENEKKTNYDVNRIPEEQLILQALESDIPGEYSPGFGSSSDVPNLNDAIPIDSDHFEIEKRDKRLEL